ncbi:flagellar biosynthesis protein FlhB [Pigmentiphaga aceris]|uniref:Flagellar biosynthetic protein FlhB n=1 Tax=Pigmentiphaga aceris TaxID=1940612 RepID=A0A5C0B228_9BURK|nr:flagellar biosynthesis protein FlhB [Pigmentiphaga aceris]QEI07230.1 flagellar biosynthesis protein FlhB [Pigmentiphaga aceris]
MAGDADSEDKTLAPSQQRLDKAREDGQVPRSRELSGALSTFAATCAVGFGGAILVADSLTWIRSSFIASGRMVATARDNNAIVNAFYEMVGHALISIAPILGAAMIAGIIGSIGLGGLLLSSKALMPDFNRLNPLTGLGRMFSSRGLGELGKSLLKVIVLGGLGALLFWRGNADKMALIAGTQPSAITALGNMLRFDMLIMASGLFIIAAADVPLQWWNHHKQMKMTLEEMKQENKESEGDPHLKGKIRQMQRERARSRMMQSVPTADVVLTNPTHYAVALKYEEGKTSAPRLLAKGTDVIAARIRELAAENKIPVLESPQLARALYRHGELEKEIPTALFRAVAQVLAYVYALRAPGPSVAWQAVDVPPGWDPNDTDAIGRGRRAKIAAEKVAADKAAADKAAADKGASA